METDLDLKAADYVILVIALAVPVAIGILYFVKDLKRATRDEYLLGGRRMSMLPVSISIFATYMSAISIVGTPVDVYTFGAMMPTLHIGFGIAYALVAFSLVPLLHPLQLTSLYKYLELRFDSKLVRICAVVIGIIQSICYMAITSLSAALGLQTGMDFPLWLSVAIVGGLGTLYTTLGGIKSVVWTDVFQGGLMVVCVVAMIIKGTLEIGDGGKVWDLAEAGGRTSFDKIDPDPRVRMSWWGTIIAGTFFWYSNICNQATVQRITAVKKQKDARNALLVNGVLIVVYGALVLGLGLVVYAYFHYLRCNPWKTGELDNRNQLVPFFFLHVFRNTPGMSGLCIGAMFSGTLSTLSSGINSLAANTVEDFLKTPLKRLKESQATLITKIISFLYGVLIIGLAFGANSLTGPVTQLVMSSVGACGGPLLGVFFLGALFRWTNKYGAVGGGGIALAINLWILVGGVEYGKKPKPLPPPPNDMCMRNTSVLSPYTSNMTTISPLNSTVGSNAVQPKSDPFANDFFPYDISFEWYAFIGTAISFTLGLLISWVTKHRSHIPDDKVLFPFVSKLRSGSKSPHLYVMESSPDVSESKSPQISVTETSANFPDPRSKVVQNSLDMTSKKNGDYDGKTEKSRQ